MKQNEKRRDEIIRELQGMLADNQDPDFHTVLKAIRRTFQDHQEIYELIQNSPDLLVSRRSAMKNPEPVAFDRAKELLRDTSFFSLTEFGRTVHAEMDAILTCARTGRSPAGSFLFTTTFPCRNCTRHIVTAGVNRVVYIEPYPKSLAFQLHYVSIVLNERGLDKSGSDRCQDKVVFEPFLGVGPRRFFDLFSMRLSTGRVVRRKEHRQDGEVLNWQRLGQRPRVPLEATSYLDRERNIAANLHQTLDQKPKSSIKSEPLHDKPNHEKF